MYPLLLLYVASTYVMADQATEGYKNQYCTDPRTMRKHAAYSEWADAYSCTRHRCQPGGRNLAIYTVGCKRVEAPESAIECEEVVEDTNMQFPFCCTRLRCLVVVRGEVWTRVLGQPWETLPAAPWSHMYKMKKPPPSDDTFLHKKVGAGPIYELQAEPAASDSQDKVRRASMKTTDNPDCKESLPRSVPSPDIVIALTTGNEEKELKKGENNKRNKDMKNPDILEYREENTDHDREHDREGDHERDHAEDTDDIMPVSEKAPETSEEKFYANSYGVTDKTVVKKSWGDIAPKQWGDTEQAIDVENTPAPEEKNEKTGLQALVDAIGNRMRDIENVVQRMSEKVIHTPQEAEFEDSEPRKKQEDFMRKPKKPNPEGKHYNRFSIRNRGGSKYLHSMSEVTTDQPLFVEDTSLNGYFVDASNSVIRRADLNQKEAAMTFMAPVENTRRSHGPEADDGEKKRKKHSHKHKRGKGKGHKKHHQKDEKKHFNKINSIETDNSLDGNSAPAL